MRTGKDRVQLAAVGEILRIDNVTIRPGDLVCGDADGVVVVPAVRAGRTLRQARAQHGYHDLQHARKADG